MCEFLFLDGTDPCDIFVSRKTNENEKTTDYTNPDVNPARNHAQQ